MPSFLGIDLNPVHYITEAADWTEHEVVQATKWTATEVGKLAGLTAKDIEKLPSGVFNLVSRTVTAVESVFWDVIHEVHHELSVINTDVGHIGSWAAGAAKWIHHAETWADNKVAGAVHVFERDVVDPVRHEVATLAVQVTHAGEALFGVVEGELHTLEVRTIAPLGNFVSHAEGWFSREFHAAWALAYGDVIGPTLATLEAAVRDGEVATEWVIKNGPGMLELVTEAADWLVWFAAHSITDFEALVKLAEGNVSVPALERGLAKGAQYADELEPWLSRLLSE